jgi:hypothetical protein
MNLTEYGKNLNNVSAHTVGPVVIDSNSEVEVYSNKGAAAALTFQLPPAKQGMSYWFVAEAAQNIVLKPQTGEKVSLAGTLQAASASITGTGAQGLACLLVCLTDGEWKDVVQRGTWA